MLERAWPETWVTTTTMTDVQATARELAEQAREQAQQAREQAQHAREQARAEAEQIRQEAERIRDEARQIRDDARREIRINIPQPPSPPGQEPRILVPPWQHDANIPGEVVDIVGMVTFAMAAVLILRPLMRAFANRFERRGTPPTALPPEVTAHMERLEQAIDAVAIEVERISEGQRYTTKLLAERVGKEG
jgi:multidrug efflux pump subunit AcrA (membrane-fusion protein)